MILAWMNMTDNFLHIIVDKFQGGPVGLSTLAAAALSVKTLEPSRKS